jgi:plastocyanin
MAPGTRLAAATAAALLGLSALTACGSSSSTAAARSSSAAKSASPSSMSSRSSMSPSAVASSHGSGSSKPATIMIMDFGFSGATKVRPGTRITIVNHDSEAHTLTADHGDAFDVKVAPGTSATLNAPTQAGSYPYHCSYHATMHGTLTTR